ncbi:MAG TPA: aldolase/citrate lyase family protein [Anaerolineaceae bacterium]|nr:aldolase/citrate lyase family protein [Anaerolineaceae bacterium]
MVACFRSRLKGGEVLYGTLITLASLETAEILADCGYDWLFIDLEHSPLGIREAQAIQQAVAGRAACVLRVPLNDEIWLKKALDTGAAGVLVPQVNSVEDAQRAVRLSKYPPQGTRSVGLTRAGGYGARQKEYLAAANEETALIIQAENIRAVENIEQIVRVDGIDAVLIGPNDLASSMGLVGQLEHPDVKAAIQRVKEACAAQNVTVGIFAAKADRLIAYREEGFRLLAAGTDALMLGQAAREAVTKLRFA